MITSKNNANRQASLLSLRMVVWSSLGCFLLVWGVIIVGLGIGFPKMAQVPMRDIDSKADVLGSMMRYREVKGEGPAIVFLHGNAQTMHDWEKTMKLLPGRHLVCLDLVGYAGSERSDELTYDLECHRQHVLTLLDQLGIDEFIVVGHSMGGTLAAWIAAKTGDRVIGSVYMAPPGVPGSLYYAWPKNWITDPGIINRVAYFAVNTQVYKTLYPDSLAKQNLDATYCYNEEYKKCLSEIHHPAMLIWSPGDWRCNIQYSEVYKHQIENLKFVEFPLEAGHMIPISHPEITAEALSEFLGSFDSESKKFVGALN